MHVRASLMAVALSAASAQATIITYTATLNGASESPPNASPGTGTAQVDWDTVLNTMRVRATFSGLLGTTTASHIHAATAAPGTGTAGVATQTPSFVGFPLGVTAGAFDNTLDMTVAGSYNAAYITANGGTPLTAMAALFSALNAGTAYLNIHSTFAGGGEIRGFLQQVPARAPRSCSASAGSLWPVVAADWRRPTRCVHR